MDFFLPPRRQEELEIPGPWTPATPARPAPVRRQGNVQEIGDSGAVWVEGISSSSGHDGFPGKAGQDSGFRLLGHPVQDLGGGNACLQDAGSVVSDIPTQGWVQLQSGSVNPMAAGRGSPANELLLNGRFVLNSAPGVGCGRPPSLPAPVTQSPDGFQVRRYLPDFSFSPKKMGFMGMNVINGVASPPSSPAILEKSRGMPVCPPREMTMNVTSSSVSPVTPATLEKSMRMAVLSPAEMFVNMINSVAPPATPAPLGKSKGMPVIAPPEEIDLTGETEIRSNGQDIAFLPQQAKSHINVLSPTSEAISFQGKPPRTQEGEAEDHINVFSSTSKAISFRGTPPKMQEGETEGHINVFSSTSEAISFGGMPPGTQEGEAVVVTSEGPSCQQLEVKMQDKVENVRIDLNKTPQQKPRRKRHRPKVIREDKPARKPKTTTTPRRATPKQPGNSETPTGKRKYVRKKKVGDASGSTPPETIGENVDPGGSSRAKSVRRCLNFDSEDPAGDCCLGSSTMFSGNAESLEDRPSGACISNGYNSTPTAQLPGELQAAGGSVKGISFDLNHLTNQMTNEFVNEERLTPHSQLQGADRGEPEIPASPPPQHSRTKMIRENLNNLAKNNMGNTQVRSYHSTLSDLLTERAKRCHNHLHDAQVLRRMNFTNSHRINRISQFHAIGEHGFEFAGTPKKRRVEEQNEPTFMASVASLSSVPCTPSRGWNLNCIVQNNSNVQMFADAQCLMALEKMPASESMLGVGQTDRNSNKGSNFSVQSCNSTMENQLLTPEKQFGDGNLNCRHPSTLAKLSSKYNNKSEDGVPGDNSKTRKGKNMENRVPGDNMKTRKGKNMKNGQFSVLDSTCANANGIYMQEHQAKTWKKGSRGRKSAQAPPLGSDGTKERSLQPSCISSIQDCQSSSNFQESVHLTITSHAFVPYNDQIDNISLKLKHLSINRVYEDLTAEAQNALVPYYGGGTLVPYTGDILKKRRPRPKVDLDQETSRVWRLLMIKDTIEGDNELNKDKEKWWEEERRVFRGRADSFIARMHLVQGDRRFSPWKGSVVDSVVGVFLTQNVSDHLSSSAFMSIAAKYPLRSNQQSRENESKSINKCKSVISVDDHIPQTEDFVEKQMAHSQKPPGTHTHGGDGLIGYSKEKGGTNFEGAEIFHLSPNSRTVSPPSVGGTNSLEAEDVRSSEDVASQKSFISSQNSSEYPFRMPDQAGAYLESNNESEDLVIGDTCNSLDSYTSFTELLKMAETTKLQKFYPHSNRGISSPEYYGTVNQFAYAESRTSVLDLRDNTSGVCSSTVTSNNSDHAQHDWSMTVNPSASYYYHGLSNFTAVEKEMGYGARERRTFPNIASWNLTPNNGTVRECMPLAGIKTDITGQQESLTSVSMSLFGAYAYAGKDTLYPQDGTAKEIFIDKQLPVQKSEDLLGRSILHNESQSSIGNSVKHQEKGSLLIVGETSQHLTEVQAQTRNSTMHSSSLSLEDEPQQTTPTLGDSKSDIFSSQKGPEVASVNGSKPKKVKPDVEKKKTFDWENLRKQACCDGAQKERSSERMDSVDWEAVRLAGVNEISETIRERGMNNMLAARIKEFLNRLVSDHGSIDLEWLRDVPPDKAKDYLLSIRGLGLKSVECVRLLTLHHLAFPVDTNVGRISVRLGWVPLQPLPESLQLHLLELYPVLETIQKYLWPRLCTLDQRTLYELHYQLITFGKVFCTKSKPNCNACPMRAECKHFASAFASARLALPGPEEKSIVNSTTIGSDNIPNPHFDPVPLPQLEGSMLSRGGTVLNNCEPIIEEPATPEPDPHRAETSECAIEDMFDEDPDEIPTIKLNLEQFTENLQSYIEENNLELQEGDMSKALIALAPEAASIPMPKLKNVSRLRTEHQVYELPDSHPLLEGLDRREPDDPCSYLLAIWTPGETAQSIEPPESCCNSQESGKLCDRIACFSCNSIREAQTQIVRGTLLIPCRTAMRGSFPLNGTYFQVNEVFADHESSHNPISVPRKWIWNLPRRTVYFGTSIPTIFKGLSTEGIQQCFWRGFVCVRGFDRITKAPRPLNGRLHFPASKVTRTKRTASMRDK